LQFNLASHGIAAAIMLPTTFCAGTTLPLITYALIRRGRGEGSIGLVYGANTVGAIIGVFFAIHVGMPELCLKGRISSGAALDRVLGLLLLWSVRGAIGMRVPTTATLVGAGGLVLTLVSFHLDAHRMASGVFRASQSPLRPRTEHIVFHKDGKTATVD